jgi:serine/threonine protein kinase
MQSEAQQLVGAVFNRTWRLARLIGEGGMGAVYEAQSLRNEGPRAIKVLHPEFAAEEQVISRFFAEAQAVKLLSHPNVAQIYEAARAEDGTPYLVMELLTGMPLSKFRHRREPVSPQVAAPIIYGILQALALAHSRGVIHRDLKPDNLFLVPDGRGGQIVKVLDFGIAKLMDAMGGMGSKTKTGVLLGTPAYMSPEQIKNSKAVDPRSDLWSLGIIFYEMVTGREPFPADNEFTRLTAVLTNEIVPVAQIIPALGMWTPFFQRALSKDPQGRFQSAAEMSQALSALANQGQKTPSAQGTMALQLPQSQQAPATYQGHPHPQSAPPQALRPSQHPPADMSGGSGYAAQQPAGFGPGSTQLGGQLQAVSIHVQRDSGAPFQARPPSVPPPGAPQGPVTHVSGARPVGLPGSPSMNPQVDFITPPPVGFPLWVVIAVGVGAFAVGLLVGALAF